MVTSLLAQRWHHRDERGASAVEYGLLATAVAALIVVVVFALGGVVTNMFGQSCDVIELQAQTGSSCPRS
ncbi:MAG TPA: Flp family type IVb pilin [Marmoricola sp.]|nr:Flp family type IVb pilin [Marmoricola sp.]